VLDLIRGPLIPAQAFRAAWDAAAAKVRDTVGGLEAPLTVREDQVVGLVALGWTNARIGRHLQISERTVRKHLEKINDKLGTANRAAAVSRWRGLDLRGR
jgi:ATP/maltotriose-dependent transcriptional regulator MalT